MENLEAFAPAVDVQAEMGTEPALVDTPTVRIDNVEAKPTETKEPEAKTEAKEEPKDEPKTVPIQALAEARRKEREWREKAQKAETEAAERFAALEKQLSELRNPPKQVPSFDENPAEHLKQKLEMTEAQLREYAQAQERERATQAQVAKQQQIMAEITSLVNQAEAEFSEKNPDYRDAMTYMQQVADRNLRLAGMDDPQERAKIVYQQSLALAANALDKGKNPAEVAYGFAKNYGWSPKVDASKQLKAIQSGTSTTQTMGSGKAESGLSLAALEQMDDEEFNATIADSKNWDKIKRLAG